MTFLGLGLISIGLLAGGLLSRPLVVNWRLGQSSASAEGAVLSMHTRHHSKKGGRGHTDYVYEYRFSTPQGADITDRFTLHGYALSEGGRVNVEYDPEHPNLHRVIEAPSSDEAAAPVVLILLSLMGGAVGIAGVVMGKKRIRLLEQGMPDGATILAYYQSYGKSGRYLPLPTDPAAAARLGRRQVQYGFTIPSGQFISKDSIQLNEATISQQGRLPVLYDPANPKRSMLFDTVQPPPLVSSDGVWLPAEGTNPYRRRIWLIALPLIPIAVSFLYIRSLLGG